MSLIILGDAVDLVAVQPLAVGKLFLHDRDVITIISIQAVTGGNPDKATPVLEHLCGKIAWELIVCIEQFSALSPWREDRESWEDKYQKDTFHD